MAVRKFTEEELQLIKSETTTSEKRDTARKYSFNPEVVNSVLRSDRSITENNQIIFKELLKKAKLNQKKSRKCQNTL